MAIELAEGQTLHSYVNQYMSELLVQVARLQVYIDDWDKLPQDFKDLTKSDLSTILDSAGTFLSDLKQFIGSL